LYVEQGRQHLCSEPVEQEARHIGKHIRHPVLSRLALEYSAFAVDGRPDLSMVVYNPATPEDAERIKSLLA
jgi:hypothetical protein